MLGASSTRKLGHSLPRFPYGLATPCGVGSVCCFLRSPALAPFCLTQYLIRNLMFSSQCHPEKTIIRKRVGNQLAKGWQPLSHIRQRMCSIQLPCSHGRSSPICRRPDPHSALPLAGCRKSSQRVFNTPRICLMGGAERIRES